MYIYQITNLINGKVYIGKSIKNAKESENYFGSGLLINYAISKYGKENFEKKILFECDDLTLLNAKEVELIAWAKKLFKEKCYNISNGGDGGDIFSTLSPEKQQEFRFKSGRSFRGKHLSPEHKRKISIAQSGENGFWFNKTFSEEHLEKLSKSCSGEKNGFYGKTHSEEKKAEWRGVDRPRFTGKTYEQINGIEKAAERKKKLSEALTGKPLSEAHKLSISRKLKGIKISEQAKKNREGLKWFVNKDNKTTLFKLDDPRIVEGGYIRGRKWK